MVWWLYISMYSPIAWQKFFYCHENIRKTRRDYSSFLFDSSCRILTYYSNLYILCIAFDCVCVCVCMCVCVCVCMCVHERKRAFMRACTFAFVRLCMHMCCFFKRSCLYEDVCACACVFLRECMDDCCIWDWLNCQERTFIVEVFTWR